MRRRLLVFTLGIVWWILAAFLIVSKVVGQPTIEITWETESEFNTAGFNVMRAVENPIEYVKINNALIPAIGSATSGSVYSFTDEDVTRDNLYFYRLEDIEYDGSSKLHEPIEVQAPGSSTFALALSLFAIIVGFFMFLFVRLI